MSRFSAMSLILLQNLINKQQSFDLLLTSHCLLGSVANFFSVENDFGHAADRGGKHQFGVHSLREMIEISRMLALRSAMSLAPVLRTFNSDRVSLWRGTMIIS